ncbi:hypothetical protein Tco_0298942 [Tanacetum coccineum]
MHRRYGDGNFTPWVWVVISYLSTWIGLEEDRRRTPEEDPEEDGEKTRIQRIREKIIDDDLGMVMRTNSREDILVIVMGSRIRGERDKSSYEAFVCYVGPNVDPAVVYQFGLRGTRCFHVSSKVPEGNKVVSLDGRNEGDDDERDILGNTFRNLTFCSIRHWELLTVTDWNGLGIVLHMVDDRCRPLRLTRFGVVPGIVKEHMSDRGRYLFRCFQVVEKESSERRWRMWLVICEFQDVFPRDFARTPSSPTSESLSSPMIDDLLSPTPKVEVIRVRDYLSGCSRWDQQVEEHQEFGLSNFFDEVRSLRVSLAIIGDSSRFPYRKHYALTLKRTRDFRMVAKKKRKNFQLLKNNLSYEAVLNWRLKRGCDALSRKERVGNALRGGKCEKENWTDAKETLEIAQMEITVSWIRHTSTVIRNEMGKCDHGFVSLDSMKPSGYEIDLGHRRPSDKSATFSQKEDRCLEIEACLSCKLKEIVCRHGRARVRLFRTRTVVHVKVARFVWGEVGEEQLTVPKEVIADRKKKAMAFNVGDMVMLKVSPWKGVIRWSILIINGCLELAASVGRVHNVEREEFCRSQVFTSSLRVMTRDKTEDNGGTFVPYKDGKCYAFKQIVRLAPYKSGYCRDDDESFDIGNSKRRIRSKLCNVVGKGLLPTDSVSFVVLTYMFSKIDE